jgi:hypothetical protein
LDTAHDSDAHRVIHAIEGGRLTGFIERPGRGADRKLVTDVEATRPRNQRTGRWVLGLELEGGNIDLALA